MHSTPYLAAIFLGVCFIAGSDFNARTILEISDCEERINLWFEVDSKRRRANSLHKLDTLIAALRMFCRGLEEPCGVRRVRPA